MSKMNSKSPGEYEVHDFLMDDRFINYHFKRNEEDCHFWNQTLISHPELQPKADHALEMLQMLTLTIPESEFAKEIQKLDKAISNLKSNQGIGTLNVLPDRQRWSRRKKIIFFLSAASVFIIGISVFLFHSWGKPAHLLSVSNNIETPIEFDLADSTTVRLGPHSTLQYPGDFNEKERTVYLEGEATFHVKRDTHHPFRVFTGHLVATVLGTIFNIEKRSLDSTLYIELIKGSLKVDVNGSANSEPHTIYLSPKERLVYKHSTGTFFKEPWNRDTIKNIIADHLVFKNADFESVARKIKAAYGITVLNLSKKKNWHYNAEFTNAEFKEVLENICVVEGLKSNLTGDSVLLR